MRKVLMVLFLLCNLAFAADVRVTGGANYGSLVRNSAWSNYTGGGQTFVFDTISTSLGACITFVNNNTTNSRTINLASATTSDLSVTTFTNNQGNWATVPVSPPQTSYVIPAFAVAANGTFQIFIRAIAAAHVALTVSGQTGTAGGSPDTVTIIFAWTGSACGGVNQWTAAGSTAAGATLNTSQAGVAGVRHVINCVSVSTAGTATAANNITLSVKDGTCAAGTGLWIAATGYGTLAAASEAVNGFNVSQCGLNISGSAGNPISICGSAGIAGVIEAGSISGYDQ